MPAISECRGETSNATETDETTQWISLSGHDVKVRFASRPRCMQQSRPAHAPAESRPQPVDSRLGCIREEDVAVDSGCSWLYSPRPWPLHAADRASRPVSTVNTT